MTNVHTLPTQKRCLDEAGDWLARLDRGLSASEEQELEAWLAQSAEHRNAFMRLASLWDKMDSLSLLAELFPNSSGSRTRKRSTRAAWYPALAASLAAIAAVGWLMAGRWSDLRGILPGEPSAVATVYETAIGERSTISLPDRSLLVLNTNSLVKVAYDDDARLLTLERGEMSIQVAHESHRPLSVVAGKKIVRAVGTAFNVQIIDERQVELIVTEGRVVVVDRDDHAAHARAPHPPVVPPRTVSKGERVLLGASQETVSQVSEIALSAELSWQQGNLVFRGETLAEAIAEVSRYTPVKFELADEHLKDIRIGGLFKAGDVDGLLATLKQNFNIESERLDPQRVRLKAP